MFSGCHAVQMHACKTLSVQPVQLWQCPAWYKLGKCKLHHVAKHLECWNAPRQIRLSHSNRRLCCPPPPPPKMAQPVSHTAVVSTALTACQPVVRSSSDPLQNKRQTLQHTTLATAKQSPLAPCHDRKHQQLPNPIAAMTALLP